MFSINSNNLQSLIKVASALTAPNQNQRFKDSCCSDVFSVKTQNKKQYIEKSCQASCASNKEIAFIYDPDKDEILQTQTGRSDSCNIDFSSIRSTGNLVLYHSHPDIDGNYLPVSFQDFKTLNDTKQLKEIVSYGSKGQKTSLRKTESFKKLSAKELSQLETRFIKNLYRKASEEDRAQIKKLHDYCRKYPKNSQAIRNEVLKLLTNLQRKPQGAEAIDLFWIENSASLGLEYHSELV